MRISVTIASGQSLSPGTDLQNGAPSPNGPGLESLVAIIMPTVWTAAAMTFQVSDDGVNYQSLFDDSGTEVNFTVSASQNTSVRQDRYQVLRRWRWVKVRSGTQGAPVSQAQNSTVILLTMPTE